MSEEPPLRLAHFTRPATAIGEPIAELVDRIEGLATAELVEEVAVHTWPAVVPLDDPTPDDGVRSTFEKIQSWASEADIRIEPIFEVVTRKCEFTGREERILRTPIRMLVVSTANEIVTIAPRIEDGEPVTIDDELRELSKRVEGSLADRHQDAAGTIESR